MATMRSYVPLVASFISLVLTRSVHAQSPRAVAILALDRDFAAALVALAGSDEARVAAVSASSLDPGCESLGGAVGSAEQRRERRRSIAAAWRGQPVSWQIAGAHARGVVGPIRPAMPTACMRREGSTWRFAGFVPGE